MAVCIRKPEENDFAQWKALWASYLVFYQATLPQQHTELLWQRIGDPQHKFQCLVAEDSQAPGRLVGLVHFFSHEDTWEAHPVCYLQDLFVKPERRRTGYGRAMIEAVAEVAKQKAWASVYWQTKHDNVIARKLYDALTGGTEGFVTYRMAL